MPLWRSLKRRPSCRTRSKAFEISQKTARISLPSSRARQIEWYSYVTWLTVESFGINPDPWTYVENGLYCPFLSSNTLQHLRTSLTDPLALAFLKYVSRIGASWKVRLSISLRVLEHTSAICTRTCNGQTKVHKWLIDIHLLIFSYNIPLFPSSSFNTFKLFLFNFIS